MEWDGEMVRVRRKEGEVPNPDEGGDHAPSKAGASGAKVST